MQPKSYARMNYLITTTMIAVLLTVTAAASSLVSLGEPRVVELGEHQPLDVDRPRVQVREMRADGLRLEFELPALAVQEVTIAGEVFHVLEIDGGGYTGRIGEPMLPTFSRLIQLPEHSGVTCEITAIETTELAGYRPLPVQPEEGNEFVIDRAVYARAGFGDLQRTEIGEPAVARELRVVPLRFLPVHYDPSRGVLGVATRIEVEVRFAGTDPRNSKARPSRVIPRSFDQLYRAMVPNYRSPRENRGTSLGTYVLICPENQQVLNALEPLIEWRTRKGFDVVLATTGETGGSANSIKAWLQNAYDTWENPPEYITLVGDVGGSIALPTWWFAGAESDHPYVQLEGDDLLADAHVGRISVDTIDRLQLYVSKIVSYESTPYLFETDWYRRACVVGDPYGSGVTCIQVHQWLKRRLLEYGYAEVDTVFDSPFITRIINAVNRGDTVFSYRGFYGTSGLTTGHIFALTNGRKMPYAVTITCGTGNYANGTSISEAWMRAGSPPAAPTGGIAAVSTSGDTHTRYNNCMVYGIWRGIFWEDLFTFGASLTRGKYELYLNYFPYDYDGYARFTHWNNLMGDPAGEIWTDVPLPTSATHPAAIPQGTNAVSVAVIGEDAPLPGAHVCLWKDSETYVAGLTDEYGCIELPVNTYSSGEMRLTVTKHDHRPLLRSILVEQVPRFVGYLAHLIDDDQAGTSHGNGDEVLNPTETIELPVGVRNGGTETAMAVTGTLTCNDPYVTILDDTEEFGDIAPGAVAWSSDDFDLQVAGGAPAEHVIRLGLDLQSGTDTWHSMIELPVTAAELTFEDVTLYDFGDEVDPGEDGEISVRIANVGGAPAMDLVGKLISDSPCVIVTDSTGTFGTIAAGSSAENEGDRFAIEAALDCLPGHLATLRLAGEFSSGMRDTFQLVLAIGTVSSTDPTGPDAYGYCAFDNTDTDYEEAPIYAWVEIAPNHGGPGSDVGLTDFGNDNDDSRVVDLPFDFTFYGETFSRVTICSNGWLAMGATHLVNQRNWTIPGAGAPPYLISPMWDDLYQSGYDRVYHWYDSAEHRYIVEWSRVRTAEGNAIQVFEVILYDPAFYTTPTGDGMIVFQYDTFQNTDWLQHYSTVGIENRDQTDGVLYSYFNVYPAGATPIVSGRAIKFTPYAMTPRGTLMGAVTNASNGGTPVAGARVTVLETEQEFMTNAAGTYGGPVPIGIHTVVAAHESFAADTAAGVWIMDSHTTELDFSLVDVRPPDFDGTTQLPNTGDELGPYSVSSFVTDFSDLTGVSLHYNPRGTGWVEVPMESQGEDCYTAVIPGQPRESLVKYYIAAQDTCGLRATDPPGAPWEAYEFWVIPPLFSDDMEAGVGDWVHYAVTGTFADQWHRSPWRNHTPDGAWSWYFGDDGDSAYANLSDGALETAPVSLGADAVLAFWYWIDAETSAGNPGYAYDGGLVEMSVGGGEWMRITPVGGYPYRVIEGGIPGPFPAETPIFSGTGGWTRVHFGLPGPIFSASFRFRFGSDGSGTGEGWFIDDVEIVPGSPGSAAAPMGEDRPLILALHPSRPNPFDTRSGATRIVFDLPHPSHVRLEVCDLSGRRVRGLVGGGIPAGRHEIAWDGRDARGRVVESGMYFFILDAGEGRQARRVLLVR